MLVCWEWLSDYVELDIGVEEMASYFAMSGLNHEETVQVGSDTVLDLEVTSNRGDCLGHIGVAREASVLLKVPLKLPEPQPACGTDKAEQFISVENRFTDACPRYTARVIRGVKVGPSPEWLTRRLAAIGIASVNNVVDVTNYVMMECGQPLHAFDLKMIRGGKIVIRPAAEDEEFLAIDHRTYKLDSRMVVIADAERAVALGGVMGGAESEVSETTVDLLIESAAFSPMAIRRAARKLKLHSPSSYRFERRTDPEGLDWASRRCCQLILELAGGELCSGVVENHHEPQTREPIKLRFSQIERVLGIQVPQPSTRQILLALGCRISAADAPESIEVTPPTWRDDLTREVDLIEEVARIYGYDQIPEDALVPLNVATPRPRDIVLKRCRHVLSAYGVDEGMTPSVVSEQLEDCGSVWSNQTPLSIETPLLVGAKLLRRSLLPSLLSARYLNQTQSIRNAQLYEVANVYLPGKTEQDLPREQSCLSIVAGGELRFIKGLVESLIAEVISKRGDVEWIVEDHDFFQPGSSQKILLGGQLLGWIGLIHKRVQDAMSLDQPATAAELRLDLLTDHLEEVRRADPVSPYPAVTRDLNFIVAENLRWNQLSGLCRSQGGESLQAVDYQETYRDAKKDGAGKKRVLLSLLFQRMDRTLTSDEVDLAVTSIIESAKKEFEATLLS